MLTKKFPVSVPFDWVPLSAQSPLLTWKKPLVWRGLTREHQMWPPGQRGSSRAARPVSGLTRPGHFPRSASSFQDENLPPALNSSHHHHHHHHTTRSSSDHHPNTMVGFLQLSSAITQTYLKTKQKLIKFYALAWDTNRPTFPSTPPPPSSSSTQMETDSSPNTLTHLISDNWQLMMLPRNLILEWLSSVSVDSDLIYGRSKIREGLRKWCGRRPGKQQVSQFLLKFQFEVKFRNPEHLIIIIRRYSHNSESPRSL